MAAAWGHLSAVMDERWLRPLLPQLFAEKGLWERPERFIMKYHLVCASWVLEMLCGPFARRKGAQ